MRGITIASNDPTHNSTMESGPKEPAGILVELLKESGSVSTMKLKAKLREAGYSEADSICEELSRSESGWKKEGRSFYTHQKWDVLKSEDQVDQHEDGDQEPEVDEIEEDHISTREKRHNRDKERRLCSSYILPFLKALYDSSFKPKENECAFVVQDQRPSTSLRNVDLVAVQWRTHDIAELIAVEAKLEFNAQLVQQAANYVRFSHRVWIATVVDSGVEIEQIIPELQEQNSLLFEYVLSLGLGIIACQKARGGSYNCYPVQWPRKQNPDEFEKLSFMESYRETFEEAGLLEKQKRTVRVA